MLGDEGSGGDEDYRETMSRVQEESGEFPRAQDVPPSETSARGAFRRIFRRALYLIGLEALLVVLMFAALPFGVSAGLAPAILIVLLVAVVAVSIAIVVNWRCPVCGGYLGGGFWGMFSVSHCIRCGARLK